MSTILQAGKIYQPTDISVDESSNSAFVVEQLNHRISKWDYNPLASGNDRFVFTLDAGKITKITVDTNGGGTGYSPGNPLVISPPTIDIDLPVQATAEVKTVSSGVITELTVLNGGNGYDDNNPPTVTAPIGGTGASLTAEVSTPWGTNRNGTTGQAGPATDGGPNDVFFDNPRSIANDGTRLYVTDTFHNRIRTLTLSTGFFISFAGPDIPSSIGLHHPTGLDIHADSNFFLISDKVNARAIKYTTGDTPSNPTILAGPTPVPFNIPHAIIHVDFGTPKTMTITDLHQGVLSEYDHETLLFLGQKGTPGADPDVDEQLYRPGGGHADSTTMIVFANTGNEVLKFLGGGVITNFSVQFGSGTALGKLYRPQNLFRFQQESLLYMLIVNTLNNRIEVFQGNALRNQFGSPVPVLP